MTEWMLRRKDGHAVGPVPTRALVRGIKTGKVPPDTEAREVGGDAWLPLASYDDFYEALGLDDAETRLVETPWFMREAPGSAAGAQDLADADEEDEEATRVMEALSESVPGRGSFHDGQLPVAPAPLPAAGQAARRPAPPPEPEPVDPLGSTVAVPGPDESAAGPVETLDSDDLEPADADDESVTSLMEAPSERSPSAELMDVDEESASAVRSSVPRGPLPAAGRPALSTRPPPPPPATTAPARPGTTSPRPAASTKGQSQRRFAPDQADERTAPAVRYARKINTQQTLLTALIVVTVFLAVLVVLLLLRA
jgi:hypothetical protein